MDDWDDRLARPGWIHTRLELFHCDCPLSLGGPRQHACRLPISMSHKYKTHKLTLLDLEERLPASRHGKHFTLAQEREH